VSATESLPSGDELWRVFEAPRPFTIGLEEELMLLEPQTLDLAPRAPEVLERVDGDARFKLELPAAQLELLTSPRGSVTEAIAELAAGRVELARASAGLVTLAGAGVHPFAAPEGELNPGSRYQRTADRYGPIARRQLVFALQVHVAPGGAERSLAVYNALRSHLPELAALAANAPFYDGADTGLASVRPKISELLPRQGVPPALASWDAYAEALRWGAASGAIAEPSSWWWELRPHPAFGTLELRVPDTQTTVAEAAAVAAFAQCLVAWLARRFDAGETLAVADDWRIAENRWSAASAGVEGELADLESGELRPTREVLLERLEQLGPVAEQLGCVAELESVRGQIAENGAMRQRRVAAEDGLEGLARWLAGRWLEGAGALAPPPSG
jgi:carboxylate-amine ligase